MAAGSAAGTPFDVRITISAGCTISNDNAAVDFGTVSGSSAKPAARTKTASITCTNGVPYDFHVVTTNGFNMKAAGGATIPYTIKAGSSTTPLGSTPMSIFSQMATGSPQAMTFSFDISSWNTASPYASAIYSDTVTLYVDF
jgi:hypothetical protein